MWFVLLFGAIALGSSAYFAARPTHQRLAFIKWMMLTTGFAVVSGTTSGLGAVFHGLGDMMNVESAQRTRILFTGLAECMSAGTLGFSLLGLTAMLTAVGSRRLASMSG
ncbi:MAG: hypothetical protein HOO96_17665 [Polyangiaceae bacterium]|nr:hypothetical protein [Polyangiaceae bacterium]